MYVIKNALRCISRSKGRNILIGIIVLAIAVFSCIGLSIRKASETAKKETLEGMSVTATISFDRQSMMQGFADGSPEGGERPEGGFDRSQFAEMMGGAGELSLEEYEKYATAESVQDFYYTTTVALNGSDSFLPVSTEGSSDSADTESSDEMQSMTGGAPDKMGGMGGMRGQMMGMDSDFSVVGVSSDSALTAFNEGTATVTEGSVFESGTDSLQCIITEELALYNDILVGDTVTLTNPNNEDEAYEITVVGIYSDTSSNMGSFSIMGSTSSDPANKIYMSAAAVRKMADDSRSVSETVTDEETGREYETALSSQTSATYVFSDTDSYYLFEEEVRKLGLDESYTVSSQDLQAFENSLVPLNTLSTMAGWFLLVILTIGAVILIVLNVFNIRERKYEIGVLCAMGMKKGKVAFQFICEIFTVTMAAVIVGAIIGAALSVPVTNALLADQIESQTQRTENIEESFGRGPGGMDMGEMPDEMPQDEGAHFGNLFGGENSYVSEISSATDITVLLQMLCIAIVLTLVSGAASMLFIMRYEPLKILANRD